jgi:serine/threonine protein kinase
MGGAAMPADERSNLEDLLAHYVDRLNGGERIEREEILAENPVHGPEILEHLEGFIEWTVDKEPDTSLGTLGDYTLRRQIGRGGMGVVYEAWENSMDRRVALKVLPVGVAVSSKDICPDARVGWLATTSKGGPRGQERRFEVGEQTAKAG